MLTTLAALVKHHSGALFLIGRGARLLLAQDDAHLNKLDNNCRILLLIASIYRHKEIVALL